MSTYHRMGTDPALEKERGVDLDFGPEIGRFTIRRAGGANARYADLVRKRILEPYGRRIEAGTLDEATARRLWAEIYADGVVIGWQGVTGEDGQEIEFTRDNAIKLFLDLPELFRRLQAEADNYANFRRGEMAQDGETLKNA